MAPDEALSQDEINRLLSQVGEVEPLPPKPDVLGPQDRAALGEWMNVVFGALAVAISESTGQPIVAGEPQTVECPSPGEWSPTDESDKLVVMVPYGPGPAESVAVVVSMAEAQRLYTPSGGEPPDSNGLAKQTQALTQAVSSHLSAIVPETPALKSPDVLPYEAGLIGNILPEEQALAQVTSVFQVGPAGGATWPMTVTILWAAQEAKTLVAKLLQPVPERQPVGVGVATTAAGRPEGPVTVQPVQFSPLDQHPNLYGESNRNLDIVLDISLNLTVELGKTEICIKELLELTRGSVIELDRVAGEPVDLMANGKLIAKGEVVVIEDNFGLRITSIVSPAERLRGL